MIILDLENTLLYLKKIEKEMLYKSKRIFFKIIKLN